MRHLHNSLKTIHLSVYSFDAADVIFYALQNRFRYVSLHNHPFDDSCNYKYFDIDVYGEFVLPIFEPTTFRNEPIKFEVLSSKKHEKCKMFQEDVYSKDIDIHFVKDSLKIWKWCIEDNFPNTKSIDVKKIDHVLNHWNLESNKEDEMFVGEPLTPFEYEVIKDKLSAIDESMSSGEHFYLLTEIVNAYEDFRKNNVR